MKIWGLMAYWNEEFYLRQSIYSVLPFVDELIMMDGAYYQYDLPDYFSSDASNAHINNIIWEGVGDTSLHWYTDEEHSFQFVEWLAGLYEGVKNHGWADEMYKRQKMIELVPDGDVMLIIDADTLMMGDPVWFREQVAEMSTRATMIPTMYYTHPASWWETPMVMKKVDGMKYAGIHWNIEYPDTPQQNQWYPPNNDGRIIEGCFQLNMGMFYRQPSRMTPKRDSAVKRNLKEDFSKQRAKQIWDKMYYEREKLKRGEEIEPKPFIVEQGKS